MATRTKRECERKTRLTLTDGLLLIERLAVAGAAYTSARAQGSDAADLEHVVRQMLEIGGSVLEHGAARATVDAVSAEVERLTAKLTVATEESLPRVFAGHADALAATLAERFDAGRTGSVQEQIRAVLAQSAAQWERDLRRSLDDADAPLGRVRSELNALLHAMATRQEQLQLELTTLTERLAARDALAAERARGTAKGLTFEAALRPAVERVFAPYADLVEDVSTSAGVDGGKKGDLLVTLNRREAPCPTRIVVEAKDRKLRLGAILDELEGAIANRDAAIGVAVFASIEQAPTSGQPLRCYDGGRIVCVFDDAHGCLALEVALQLARALARAGASQQPLRLDTARLRAQLDALAQTVDRAKDIARGANTARRGLDQVDAAYAQLRRDAHAQLDGIAAALGQIVAAKQTPEPGDSELAMPLTGDAHGGGLTRETSKATAPPAPARRGDRRRASRRSGPTPRRHVSREVAQ